MTLSQDILAELAQIAIGSPLDNLPSNLGHCGVCHYDFNGSGPKNPYGNAILNSGFPLNSDAGRSNAI